MCRHFWIVLLVICGCSQLLRAQRKTPVAAASDNRKPLAVIPFRIVNNAMVIPVLLSGSSDTLHFIFDSGAAVTVLHTGTANRLRIKGNKEEGMVSSNNLMIKVPTASLSALYLHQVRLPFVKAYLENLAEFNGNGQQTDGIIGIDLLKPYIVRIDNRRQQLIIYAAGKTPRENGQLLPFHLNFTTPVISAGIQTTLDKTIEGNYHVVTGGDYGILFNWPFVTKHRLHEILPTLNTSRIVDMAQILYYINSSLPVLQFNGYRFNNVPVSYCKDVDDIGAFSEVAGSIGYEIWKNFNLTFNYRQRELCLERL